MTFWMNGEPWHVQRVGRSSPALVDRTGTRTVATTDPSRRLVCISEDLKGEELARVAAHEATHACMVSYGMDVREFAFDRIRAEEWACNLMAEHMAEVV